VTFQSWINSFDLEDPKGIWQNQNLISNLCALPMVFMVGKLSDKVSAKIIVPAVLLFQIILMAAYMFCHDPSSWYAYFLSVFQGGSGFMIVVSMQGYAVKRVPKMIRGIIMSLIGVFSAIGTILYLQIQKIWFNEHPNMVFGTLGIFDVIVLIIILISIAFGWYGHPPANSDEDGGSKAAEHQANNVEDVGFKDEFPEVPFAKDLYDEAVPEVSEYREQSVAPYSMMEDSLIEGTLAGRQTRHFRDTLRKSKKNIDERSKVFDSEAENSFDDGMNMQFFSSDRNLNKQLNLAKNNRATQAIFVNKSSAILKGSLMGGNSQPTDSVLSNG